ncbi:MAG: hypothetical protein QXY55_04350 [Candidatus Korarchaeota archaeon]
MTYYVNPKFLKDSIKRDYLKASEKFGAEIRVRILEIIEPYARAIIEVNAPKELLRALKHLGIGFSKEPMPAKFSFRVLVQLLEKISEGVPIGIGDRGNIVRVDISKPIAVDDIRAALYLSGQQLLWIDLVGNQIPSAEFIEIDGFPVPTSETKLYDLASILARAFNKRVEHIVGIIKAKLQKLMADEEAILMPMPEIDELFRWSVLVEDEQLPQRAYLDLTGLPAVQQKLALEIATNMWPYDLVVALPYPWRSAIKLLKRGHVTIVTRDPLELDVPTVITENRVVKRVVIEGRNISGEIKCRPLWKIASSFL